MSETEIEIVCVINWLNVSLKTIQIKLLSEWQDMFNMFRAVVEYNVE